MREEDEAVAVSDPPPSPPWVMRGGREGGREKGRVNFFLFRF